MNNNSLIIYIIASLHAAAPTYRLYDHNKALELLMAVRETMARTRVLVRKERIKMILTCPKCGNTEDFRKQVTGIVAITNISPIVEDGDSYFEDRSDVDIYPFPEDMGGITEIYCNKCDFFFDFGSPCNNEMFLVGCFKDYGWLK